MRRTSTRPCDKQPRRAASTEDIGAHKTTLPRITTYDRWLPPYGATRGALHTAVHSHDLQAEHEAQDIAARLDNARRQLREWHVRRAKELAQEQQRYFQNPQHYKSLKHVDKVLREPGHRGIKAVHLQDSTVTNDLKVVLEEVLNRFEV